MKHPIILDGAAFDWAEGAEYSRQAVDNEGNVNWKAAFFADPGVMSCPQCRVHLWCEGLSVRCPDCGHEFRTPRPFDPAWARSTIRYCAFRGIACFVKQLGSAASDPVNGIAGSMLRVPPEAEPLISRRLRDRKGGDPAEWPEDLRVRQWPRGGE